MAKLLSRGTCPPAMLCAMHVCKIRLLSLHVPQVGDDEVWHKPFSLLPKPCQIISKMYILQTRQSYQPRKALSAVCRRARLQRRRMLCWWWALRGAGVGDCTPSPCTGTPRNTRASHRVLQKCTHPRSVTAFENPSSHVSETVSGITGRESWKAERYLCISYIHVQWAQSTWSLLKKWCAVKMQMSFY